MTYLSVALTFLIVGWASKSLLKTSQVRLKADQDGARVLRPSRIYEIIGWAGPILAVVIFFVGFTQSDTRTEFFIWFGASCTLIILGAVFLLFRRNVSIIFDENKIEHTNLFLNKKIIEWKEVEKIEFNNGSRDVSLVNKNTKINVNLQMYGFEDFLDTLKSKVNPSIYEPAVSEINKLFRVR